jgi:hypothetical protein
LERLWAIRAEGGAISFINRPVSSIYNADKAFSIKKKLNQFHPSLPLVLVIMMETVEANRSKILRSLRVEKSDMYPADYTPGATVLFP